MGLKEIYIVSLLYLIFSDVLNLMKPNVPETGRNWGWNIKLNI